MLQPTTAYWCATLRVGRLPVTVSAGCHFHSYQFSCRSVQAQHYYKRAPPLLRNLYMKPLLTAAGEPRMAHTITTMTVISLNSLRLGDEPFGPPTISHSLCKRYCADHTIRQNNNQHTFPTYATQCWTPSPPTKRRCGRFRQL